MYSITLHYYFLKTCKIVLGDNMTKFKREFEFNDNIIEVIAYNVIKYRKLNKITQEQLAVDVGKSYDFIRRLEYKKGAIGCSIDTLYKISVVLGVTMDKFFE